MTKAKWNSFIRLNILVLLSLLALMGCEDAITPRVNEDVRLAKLPQYTLTIQEPAVGSVTPSGAVTVRQNEPLSIAATVPTGGSYAFLGWQVISSSGTVAFDDVNALSTVVRVDGGDATIQPLITDTPRSLTIQNDGHGTTTPSGSVTVANSVPYQLHANSNPTYLFDHWSQTGGTGVVSFSDASNKDATVTVTGGDATILASFHKETIGFVLTGSLGGFAEQTMYPENGTDLYLNGDYLYVLGARFDDGLNGVVRRFNVSTPANPTTTGSDYAYASGVPRALVGDGTCIFAGTSSTGGNIYKFTISTFGPSQTPAVLSPAVPVFDLALNAASDLLVWAISSSDVRSYTRSNLSLGVDLVTDTSGWSYLYIERTPYELLAVQEASGAYQMGSYGVDGVSGATSWTEPDSTASLNTGGDMDPGDSSRIAMHPDGNKVAVAIYDPTDGYALRTYTVGQYDDIAWTNGQAILAGEGLYIAMSDNYAYIAAVQGTTAHIYAVDVSTWVSPVLRTNYTITGFERVDSVALSADGNYLYVTVRNATDAKLTLQVYQITRN
jgi:hypothetical protein